MNLKGILFNKKEIDWPLLIIVAILVMIGIVMNFSTTSIIGVSEYEDAFYFVKKQLFFLAIGSMALIVGFVVDHRYYQKWGFSLFFLSVGILGLTLIPDIGVRVGGASRWLDIGFFYFQPVEVVKISLAIFIAISLSNKSKVISEYKQTLIPLIGLVLLPIIILGVQPDLGNIVLILGVVYVLFFIAGVPLIQLGSMAAFGILCVGLSVATHPYQWIRVQSFLDPWKDPLGKSYHITQSLIAIGSGGVLGHGFGESKLKYFYLPLQYSDFVFSVICEEGGLIFAVLLLGMLGALLLRGCVIGYRSKSLFSYYLAIGLTLFMVFQALINIGVAIGVFPVTGIPLTFISYGGSSFVVSMFSVGVLLNIAKKSL